MILSFLRKCYKTSKGRIYNMNQQLNDWIDLHRNDIIEALSSLIQCPSVKSTEVSEEMPFGKGIADALDFMMSLAGKYGFTSKNLDGYAGFIESEPYGEELIGILTHLDVVPAGEGWSFDPFGGTIENGRLYGRGTMDDKGPAIAAFFAMLALRECQIPLSRRLRLIMGCDEESGLTCIDHYCKTEEIPTMSFSPDADYPLVNSEKNIYHAFYECSFSSDLTIQCGERVNIVPLTATAVVPFEQDEVFTLADKPMKKIGFEYKLSPVEAGSRIEVFGKASHSSHPENGKNALQALFYLLTLLPLKGKDRDLIHLLYDMFKLEYNGESLGLCREDESGNLTLNVGVMHWTREGFEMQIDVRAPLSVTREEIEGTINNRIAGSGIICGSKTKFVDGLYVPEDSELVVKLLGAYRDFTGDFRPPIKIGGGTYARKLPNAVAFGIEFPEKGSVMHMPDEYIDIDDLILDTKILAHAMMALATI